MAKENVGFGDGSDGDLTISSNTTQSPHDAVCSGSAGDTALTFSSASSTFASMDGEIVLIYQARGSTAGRWELNRIASVSGTTSGTITLTTGMKYNYSNAQVIRLLQYRNITVNTGITYTAKAWDGSKGGLLALLASGKITVTGTINGDGKGFRGGVGGSHNSVPSQGFAGEGTDGASVAQRTANGNGGGGAFDDASGDGQYSGGGGGGGASAGESGASAWGSRFGIGGGAKVDTTAVQLYFGGGGGGGAVVPAANTGEGGDGGALIMLFGAEVEIAGAITTDGTQGTQSDNNTLVGGGGGGGGQVAIFGRTVALGTNKIGCVGGPRTQNDDSALRYAGAGSTGAIYVEACSVSGSTTPTYSSPPVPPSYCVSGSLIM